MKLFSTVLLALTLCLSTITIQAQNYVSLYNGSTLINSYNTIAEAYTNCSLGTIDYTIKINSNYPTSGLGSEFSGLGLTLGTHSGKSVTIRSSSTNSFTKNGSIRMITFNGTKNVTIDGSDITGTSAGGLSFTNISTLSESLFEITGGASNITIKYCTFSSQYPGAVKAGLLLISDGGNSKINILNNIFQATSTGNTYRIAISSSSASSENNDVTVQGNTFTRYTENAIYTSSNNNAMANWTIQSNNFNMPGGLTISSAINHEVVFIAGGSGHKVLSNTFGDGVYAGNNVYNVVVSSNNIDLNFLHFGNKTSGTILITGNLFYKVNIAATNSYVFNSNMIKLEGAASYTVGKDGESNIFGSTTNSSDGLIFSSSGASKVWMINNLSSKAVKIEYNTFDNISTPMPITPVIIDNVTTGGVTGSLEVNNNNFGAGIGLTSSSQNTNNFYVVHVNSTSSATIQNNTVAKIKNINNVGAIFYVEAASSATIRSNTISDISYTATGVLSPTIRLVDVSVSGSAVVNNNNFYNINIPFKLTGISIANSTSVTCNNNNLGMNTGALKSAVFDGIYIVSAESVNPSITVQQNSIVNIQATNGTDANSTNKLIEVMQSAVLDSNIINNVNTTGSCFAITMRGGGTCKANQISNITSTSLGSIQAIAVSYNTTNNAPLTIVKNRIQTMYVNSPLGAPTLMGMYVFFNQACSNVNIVNNFIDLLQLANYELIGIHYFTHALTTTSVNILHNTILFRSGATNLSSNSTCLKATGPTSAVIKNNIFYNSSGWTGTGAGTGKTYVEDYSGLTASASLTTNSNYLFSKLGNGFAFPKGSNTAVTSFDAWKTAIANNSLGGSSGNNPVTFSSTDEKPTGYFPGAAKGENLGLTISISNDRLGNSRTTSAPWMGSYEGFQIKTADLNINPPIFCRGQSFTINFEKAGKYSAGTTYKAILSDASGNFSAVPTQIGSTSLATATTINVKIPTANIDAGTKYRIKVVTNVNNEVSIDNGADLTITVPTIAKIPVASVCSGSTITFTTPSNTSFTWTRGQVADITPKIGGSGTTSVTSISEVLTNSNATTRAVTYVITPVSGTCVGDTIHIIKNIVYKTLTPTPANLPQPVEGEMYVQGAAFTLAPPNGTATFTLSGTLPSGLNYNATTGKISGTPDPGQSGNFLFSVSGQDATCILTQNYIFNVRKLINPNLKFTPAIVDKSYGDDPFSIPVTSRSNGALTYSIETNTSASINATNGKITILNANPSSFIWVYVNQASTSLYSSSKDSVRLYIRKATPKVVLTSSTSYALGNPRPLTYSFTKGYPISTPPTEALVSQEPSIASVTLAGDSIYPITIGSFSVLFSFPELPNYNAFDSTLTFTVYKIGVAPIAVNDTIRVIRNTDNSFTVDTVNVVANDISKTGLIKIADTDIDADNIGSQYLYFKPSIGTFVLDTITGNLVVSPYVGLNGTTSINYYVVDEDGLISAPAKIVIIVEDQAATPPLKANEVMTPNGDGNNDALVIGYTDISLPNNILIFDVAGNTLYQSDNYQNDWEGNDNKGKQLEAGVYFFVFKEKTGSQRELTGYVKITR